jgi:hypothetical protein
MIAGMTIFDSHGAVTVLGLANSTIATAKTLVDLAKNTTNHELKTQISDVYDGILEMKAKILDLDEENRALKEQLRQKANIKRDPEHGYWFKEGETDPLCRRCYESPASAIVYLPPVFTGMAGRRRICNVCKFVYSEGM